MTARPPAPGTADAPGATTRGASVPPSEAPSLPVSETFTSIQGEGRLAGVASFFVRVSGCNLRCAWCDTPYASWAPEGEPISRDCLLRRARESGVRHAVLTGGEPMMFPALAPLASGLRDLGLHVTVETAGTVFLPVACDLMSVSPKLGHSTPGAGDPRDPGGVWRRRHEGRRLNPPVLQRLIDAFPNRQLKFVVERPGDAVEVDRLLSGLRGWRGDEVFLMPQGVVTPSPETRAWVAAECVRRGWRYGHRLHIELFGNRRGT